MKVQINNISTELSNENTKNIDVVSILDGVKLFNCENKSVLGACAINMLMEITNCNEQEVKTTLKLCNNQVKNTLICLTLNVDFETSKELIKNNNGKIRNLI